MVVDTNESPAAKKEAFAVDFDVDDVRKESEVDEALVEESDVT